MKNFPLRGKFFNDNINLEVKTKEGGTVPPSRSKPLSRFLLSLKKPQGFPADSIFFIMNL